MRFMVDSFGTSEGDGTSREDRGEECAKLSAMGGGTAGPLHATEQYGHCTA